VSDGRVLNLKLISPNFFRHRWIFASVYRTPPLLTLFGPVFQAAATTSEDERKVPLLGDIPALGALFRSKQTAKEKKELVFFLTPTIVE
jgi:hypothetical protein